LQRVLRRQTDLQGATHGPAGPGGHGRRRLFHRAPIRVSHQRAHRLRSENGSLRLFDGALDARFSYRFLVPKFLIGRKEHEKKIFFIIRRIDHNLKKSRKD